MITENSTRKVRFLPIGMSPALWTALISNKPEPDLQTALYLTFELGTLE